MARLSRWQKKRAKKISFSSALPRNRWPAGAAGISRSALLTMGDYYMHLADLKSYLEADRRLCDLYSDSAGWSRKAILNVAGSGKFSSDPTIAECAADTWDEKACPVP